MNGIYRSEQINNIWRNQNDIYAHKVLDRDDTTRRLFFKLFRNSDEVGSMECSVGLYAQLTDAEYVDLSVWRPTKNSLKIKLWGETPPEFVPKNGEDISF